MPGVTRIASGNDNGGAWSFDVESAEGTDVRRELVRAIVSKGWGLLEMRPVRLSLEEIYLQLTTEEDEQPDERQPSTEGGTEEVEPAEATDA